MSVNNFPIWIYREARSGSNWVCNTISKLISKSETSYDGIVEKQAFNAPINRNAYFQVNSQNLKEKLFLNVFQKINNLNSTSLLLTSHYFFTIPCLEKNTLLLRTTRRNRVEQCLSMLYIYLYPKGFKHHFVDKTKNFDINSFYHTISNPIVVDKTDVLTCLRVILNHDVHWNLYAKDFNNFVIVYEDCETGVYIPHLDINLKFSDHSDHISKMPEYKTKVFKNYDEVVFWINEFLSKHPITQY